MVAVFRSALFWVFIVIWLLVFGVLGVFLLPFGSQKLIAKFGDFWGRVTCGALSVICGIKVKVMDEHYIPKGACLVAAKHQSAWETLFLPQYLGNAAFVLKKELLSIPIFGWYLRSLEMIAVDRRGGVSIIKQMTSAAKRIVKDGRKIVIFPEGTRVKVGESVDYKPGVAALYKELENISILPVAVNSGEVWPGKSMVIRSGIIKVKFLKPISGKMQKKELLEKLKKEIDSATNSL